MKPEQIKNKILSRFKNLTEFADKYDLNYQLLSNTINGRANNKRVAFALQQEFGIKPYELPRPPKVFQVPKKLKEQE